jgi:hypothetical protein
MEDDMGMACSTHLVEDEYILDFGGEARRQEAAGKTLT